MHIRSNSKDASSTICPKRDWSIPSFLLAPVHQEGSFRTCASLTPERKSETIYGYRDSLSSLQKYMGTQVLYCCARQLCRPWYIERYARHSAHRQSIFELVYDVKLTRCGDGEGRASETRFALLRRAARAKNSTKARSSTTVNLLQNQETRTPSRTK